jgi:DNA-directed RNA polymerase specialized sigma subunit
LASELTHVRLDHIESHANQLRYGQSSERALKLLRAMRDNVTDIATEIVQEAYNDGLTKRRIAELLDVPLSALRDMRRTKVRA